METISLQFFLYLSKFIHSQNPSLLMTDQEVIPEHFCSGAYFPVGCIQYEAGDITEVAEQLRYKVADQSKAPARDISPVFLYGKGHINLLGKLSNQPLTFTKNHVWVMPLDYVSILPLRLDSNIFFYNRTSARNFMVYESYAIKGGVPLTTLLFKWPEELPRKLKPINLLEKRTLKGTILNIAWHGSAKRIRGPSVDQLTDLQEKLSFAAQIIPAQDKSWGGKRKNGTWNGLVGMLTEKKIDVTFGSPDNGIMMTQERQSVVDFLWSIEHITMTLLVSKSSRQRLNSWVYVTIFPLTACTVVLEGHFGFSEF